MEVCDAAVRRAVEVFGGLHIVVNNAGIARWAPFLDHSEEDWDRTFDVNLKAVFLLSRQAARVMVEQGERGGSDPQHGLQTTDTCRNRRWRPTTRRRAVWCC